jgi:hypothetical protein
VGRIVRKEAERIAHRAEHAEAKARRERAAAAKGSATSGKGKSSAVAGTTKIGNAKGGSVHPTTAQKKGFKAATAHFKPGSQVTFHGGAGKGNISNGSGHRR